MGRPIRGAVNGIKAIQQESIKNTTGLPRLPSPIQRVYDGFSAQFSELMRRSYPGLT
jgi:hypothetical protein